jgi:glycosyltransferase involved in cell wall biosynthesis
MRIAIDVSQIVYGTGVSQYTIELVKNLLKLDKENEYVLFAGALRRKEDILKIFPQARVFPIPPTLGDFVWNRLHRFPIEKLIGKVDVFHTSDWTEPPSQAFKVTTVHDLIPLRFPKMIHKKIREVHVRRLEWVKKESKRIIVPSTSTKEDLMSFGVNADRIRVISEAPVMVKANQSEIDSVKKKFRIADNYLIAFGSAPYKNIERIVRAYELSASGEDLKLVVVGKQSITTVKENRNVRLTGYVEDSELSALITGSKALVFASLYEGFGQPILEAFTCGVPVVTSNISSMPEVAGDAAVLVDPYDINSIAEGIKKALDGPKGLIEKGDRRIKDFSWEKTAKETLDVYNEAKL